MEKKLFWRQGDVGILKIDKIPDGAKKVKHDGVLAYGEVTGHKHQLVGGKVKYFMDEAQPNKLYFRVESRFATLNHGIGVGKANVPTEKLEVHSTSGEEGHFSHKLPAGDYTLLPQMNVDFMTEALKPVVD